MAHVVPQPADTRKLLKPFIEGGFADVDLLDYSYLTHEGYVVVELEGRMFVIETRPVEGRLPSPEDAEAILSTYLDEEARAIAQLLRDPIEVPREVRSRLVDSSPLESAGSIVIEHEGRQFNVTARPVEE